MNQNGNHQQRKNLMTIKQQHQVEHQSFNNYSRRIPLILLLKHQNAHLRLQRKSLFKKVDLRLHH